MWPSEWTRIENETPEILRRWRGTRGEPWQYSTSHNEFLIRFYRGGKADGLFLFCKGCSLVHFESSWLNMDVKITISKDQFGPVFTIIDGDRLKIVCIAAFLAETSDYSVRLQDQ